MLIREDKVNSLPTCALPAKNQLVWNAAENFKWNVSKIKMSYRRIPLLTCKLLLLKFVSIK